MGETVTLDLELTVNRLIQPARTAASALDKIEQQRVKAQAAAQKAADRSAAAQTKAWEKIQRALQKQNAEAREAVSYDKQLASARAALNKLKVDSGGYKELLKVQKQVAAEQEKLAKKAGLGGSGNSFLSGLKKGLPVGDIAKGSFYGGLAANAVTAIAGAFVSGAEKAVDIVSEGIKFAFEAIGKEQERIAGYDLTLGKSGSKTVRADIERFAPKTAFSASQNQDLFLPLARAGLKGQDARSTYAASLDLAAARGKGSDQGAVQEAVQLFARIQQKGGISSKQLAGVGLGDTNLPAFFKSLGDKLGISAQAAQKKASKPGEIDPLLIRNTIYEAIERQQGGKLGTGAERAGSSLFGQINKLKEIPSDFFEALVDSPAIGKFADTIGSVIDRLNPNSENGKKIVDSLMKAFQNVADMVQRAITPENIDRFGAGIQKAVDFAAELPGIFERIYNIAATILDVGSKIVAVADAPARLNSYVDSLFGASPEKQVLPLGDDLDRPSQRIPSSAPASTQRGAVQLEQNGWQVNVTLPPGADAKTEGQRFAEGMTRGTVNQLERAAQERGAGGG
jgi:hypothetical protein